MPQYLPLPDGSFLQLREGENAVQAMARAEKQYPEIFGIRQEAGQPEGGFIPATKAAVSSLKSDIAALMARTGITDPVEAEKYLKEQEEYRTKTFKPTEEGWTEAPWTKFKETLGGSLPYMAAPVAAAAATATLPITGTAATLTGLGAAGTASFMQFAGSNLSRQLDEGKKLSETDLAAASLAAVPQAALDTLSLRMMPGVRGILGKAGIKTTEREAADIAKETTTKMLMDYSLATGKAATIEGLTEAGQQVFERMQAGLNIADPDARREYFDSFIGGAVLGGVISPAGRFVERGQEKRKAEEKRLADIAAKFKAERAAAVTEADKQLAAEAGAPLLTGEEATQNLFVDEKGKIAPYTTLTAREQQLAEQEQAKATAQEQYTEIGRSINALRERAQTATPQEVIVLGQQAQELEKQKFALEKRTKDKKDVLYKTPLIGFEQLTQQQAEQAQTSYDAINAQLKKLGLAYEKAKDAGDVIKQGKVAEQIQALEEQLKGTTEDLFGARGMQQIEQQKAQEKEAKELEERRTVFNAALLMLGKRAERAKEDEDTAEAEKTAAQEQAVKKLEFGLDRMGLSALGISGEDRIKSEVDLEKGVITPEVAEKLGLYTDAYNRLVERQKEATDETEKANIENELAALETKASAPTRAVDVLDLIEEVHKAAVEKQRDITNAIAADKFDLFDDAGVLTKQGREAVANEAILQQLDKLRRLGRESKQTLEEQRAEDVFAEQAKTKTELRMEQIVGEAGAKPAMELEEGKPKQRDFTSRNEAFEALSDSAHKLQKGVFTGSRLGVTGLAGEEEARNAALAQKVKAVKAEIDKIKKAQLMAETQNLPALERRQTVLEGRLKKLQAGLTERLRDPTELANRAIEQTEELRKETGRPPLTANERARIRQDVIENYQPEVYGTIGPKDRQLVGFRQEVARIEKAAKFLMDDAVQQVNSNKLATTGKELTREEETRLRIVLKQQLDEFINRVTAAERTGTGKIEMRPALVTDKEGRQVVKKVPKPAPPPLTQRPYEKLQTALKVLRGFIEDTIAEAEGKPMRGEFEELPVERPPKKAEEKPPRKKTEAEKGRIRAAPAESLRAANRIQYAQQLVSDNQETIKNLTAELQKNGVEISNQRKAAKGDKNPTMRLQKVERLEKIQANLRKRLASVKDVNKQVVAMLHKFGVDLKHKETGAELLERLENERLSEKERRAAQEQTTADLVKENEARIAKMRRDLKQMQDRVKAIASENYERFKRKNFKSKGEKTKNANKIAANEELIDDFEDRIKALEQNIAKAVGTEFTEIEKGTVAPRFTEHQIGLMTDELDKRIQAVLARKKDAEQAQKDFESERKAQLQVGTYFKTPGVSYEKVGEKVMQVPKPAEEYKNELDAADAKIAKAEAQRDAIAAKNKAEGKPVKSEEWNAANGEVRKLQNAKGKISELLSVVVPVYEKKQLFAGKEAVEKTTSERVALGASYTTEKQRNDKETVAGVLEILQENLKQAEAKLAAIPAGDKKAISAAKGQVTRARNAVSKAKAFEHRTKLAPDELKTLFAETNSLADDFFTTTDFDVETLTDQEIIDGMTYNDEVDFRIGEAATDMIDEKAAIERLEEVKKKAKAQGIDFEYYRNVGEMPIGLLKQIAKQGADVVADQIKGGVWKGKVFVVVQNHNDLAEIETTLAHEFVGHYSFNSLVGRKGMIRLLRRIEKQYGKVDSKGMERNGLEVLAEKLGVLDDVHNTFQDTIRGYQNALERGEITEAEVRERAKLKALGELVAYTTEKMDLGIPKSKAAAFKQWIKDIFTILRARLSELFFKDAAKFTNEELYALIRQAKRNFEAGKSVIRKDADGTIWFSKGKAQPNPGFETAFGGPDIVAKQEKASGVIKANAMGLNFRTLWVDQRAAVEAAIKRGKSVGLIDDYVAADAMYFMREADQNNNWVSNTVTKGTPSLMELKGRAGQIELAVKNVGMSLVRVVEPLKNAMIGNDVFTTDAFSKYLIAYRAIKGGKGADIVDIKGKVSDADLKRWYEAGEKIPAFVEARKRYNEYNKGLLNFLVQSGAISQKLANELLATESYVPYYRKKGDVVELLLGDAAPIRIGDLKNQPHLYKLVGDDALIMDFYASSLRNTQMIVNMGLKNLATRNVAFALQQAGIAEIHKGDGPASADVIRFQLKGEKRWARIDTKIKEDLFGDIPTELITRGMEGIQVMLPSFIKYLSLPRNLLRKFILLDPRYALRQPFRESLSAWGTTGADAMPLLSVMKNLVSVARNKNKVQDELQRAGVLSGHLTTLETPEALAKALENIAYGRKGWGQAVAMLENWSMAGEAATKVSLYESFIRQGLSEREAQFATMESANMSRRGLSPNAYYANQLILFFNAGLQGIDVLWRAYKGDMPYNERLKVQRKLLMRGLLLAAGTALYAAMMEDDKAYKNATPEQRYGNWFVPVPGLKEPIRVPIPFEFGLIAKALPEGIVNAMAKDADGEKITKALVMQAIRSLPGNLTEGVPLPTAIKPILELSIGKSLYTGRDIVDQRLDRLDKSMQAYDKTPEALKIMGPLLEMVGISPAQAEHVIRGYFGSLGIGLMSLLNPVFATGTKGEVEGRITDIPIIGGLFQPTDAGGLINNAYDSMKELVRRQNTYTELVNSGRTEEATKYMKEHIVDLAMASMAGQFRQQMGEFTAYERQIKALPATAMSPEKKREELDKIREMKIKYAEMFTKLQTQTERRAAH